LIKKKKYIIIIFALLSVSFAKAQQCVYQDHEYNFINYDTNYLHFYGDVSYAKSFFEKIDRLITYGDENINIIHFGGSHIQAGYWSGQIRKRLENMYPGLIGSLGYVFPFTIAKTNIPNHYRAEYTGTWDCSRITDKAPFFKAGAGGIAAHTNDTPASILIRKANTNDLTHRFNKISLLHDTSSNSFKTKLNLNKNTTISYSYSEPCKTVYILSKPIDTLSFSIIQTDSMQDHFTFYGAYLENTNYGITYSGIGINGAATSSYLKTYLFEEQLCLMYPDLVIFSIGVNDAAGRNFNQTKYQENYSKIIEKIRSINPACMFVFTTNNDFYSYSGINNPHSKAIYQSMESLSLKYGGAIWDLYTIMGGNRSINIWRSKHLAKNDRIHFTKEGYKLIGNLFFDAFLKAYTAYLKEQYQYVELD